MVLIKRKKVRFIRRMSLIQRGKIAKNIKSESSFLEQHARLMRSIHRINELKVKSERRIGQKIF